MFEIGDKVVHVHLGLEGVFVGYYPGEKEWCYVHCEVDMDGNHLRADEHFLWHSEDIKIVDPEN